MTEAIIGEQASDRTHRLVSQAAPDCHARVMIASHTEPSLKYRMFCIAEVVGTSANRLDELELENLERISDDLLFCNQRKHRPLD